MKSNLPIIIVVSLVMLASTVLYSVGESQEITPHISCGNEIICFVKKETNSFTLILETEKKEILFPVLESSTIFLTENTKVRLCYSKIDNSKANHKTIFINKVVFLP